MGKSFYYYSILIEPESWLKQLAKSAFSQVNSQSFALNVAFNGTSLGDL